VRIYKLYDWILYFSNYKPLGLQSLLLSLQETLCGCRPKVLGNLRNKCFLYFVKMDQWDNSIQLMAFRHQSDKQIDSALQDWLNSKIALSG
jgi:hypothetical protein